VLLASLLPFLLALALRVLFWQATPDRAWAYSAAYKGDAILWLQYARSLQLGVPFELGLPLHPPGAGYLVALLWNGAASGLPVLRAAFALMGAGAVGLFVVAVSRSIAPATATLAGLLAACSTGLVVLSASVNSETPYLLLVMASFVLLQNLAQRPRPGPVLAWSALQGLACLFRVEHALLFAAMLAWLGWRWRRASPMTLALVAFLLVLLPWHVRAWTAVARFNREPLALEPAEAAGLARLERGLGGLPWDAAARAEVQRLPAFARRHMGAFVAATARHRGATEVRVEHVAVLEEAFGPRPRPLRPFPFVSLYGPLNFALANHATATGGFSTALLEEPPPLLAHPERYPPELRAGLPPPQLSLHYPPHLHLVHDGHARGARFIVDQPGRFLALAARRLRSFWSGAALGLTGYNLPGGLGGTRRAVDLLTPRGWIAGAWELGVLGLCLVGLRSAAGAPALQPWLLFLLTKAAVSALFFGYAREGAAVIPVVALLAALGVERLGRMPSRRVLVAAGVVALGIEAIRCGRPPRLVVAGQQVQGGDPVPADRHRDEHVVYR
jgi:hypothetical protein